MKKLFFGLFAFLILLGLYPILGGVSISWSEALRDESQASLILDIRLQRMVLILVTGGSLSVIGGAYQVLFRNALAEPYALGISSAVTLGIVLTQIIFHLPPESTVATLGGLSMALIIGLLLALLSPLWSGNSNRLILFGMGLNFLFSSLVFILLSYYFQSMGQGSMRWLFGQIPWISWREALLIVGLGLPLNLLIIALSRPLDALSLGDRVAKTLGYSVDCIRGALIVLSSLLLGLLVPFTGAIGFVGLIVPHTVRLCFQPGNNRRMMSMAFLAGGAFLLLSDLISRLVLPPFEFPIGIITTIVGAPAFLYLLWRAPQ